MKYNIENRIKDTAIVNLTDFQNAIDLYEEGEIEKALELTFGLIALGLGSDFETDDREVRRLLRNREYTVIKSNEAYCNKLYSKEEGQRNKLQLDDIAEMMANGATQQVIADSLSVSLDTIKYRVKIMKEKFPALYTESVKKCKKVGVSGSNDNDNDNDNDNVKEIEKDLVFPSEKPLVSGDSKMSKVIYISDKPIEEEQASAAKTQKQINKAANGSYNLFELLYSDVDEEELKNAKTFEEKKKALGF